MAIFQSIAQKKNKPTEQENLFLKNIKPFILNQQQEENQFSTNLPFSRVEFIDGRFDTSFIGYGVNVSRFVKLTFAESLPSYIGNTINKYTSPKGAKALCIIHEFKIAVDDTLVNLNSKMATELSIKKNIKDTSSHIQLNSIYKLHAKIDVFIEDQQLYKAAFRLDTLILDVKKATPNNSNFINQFYRVLTKKLSSVNLDKIKTKKGYTLNDIKESIDERFNIPILKDQLYKKGVYANFDEFINNRPSFTSFEIKRDKYTDDIFVQTPNQASPSTHLRSAYGYCDGKYLWILVKDNLFQLYRQGQGFSFFGFNGLSNTYQHILPQEVLVTSAMIPSGVSPMDVINNRLNSSNTIQRFLPNDERPYILSLENGSIY